MGGYYIILQVDTESLVFVKRGLFLASSIEYVSSIKWLHIVGSTVRSDAI